MKSATYTHTHAHYTRCISNSFTSVSYQIGGSTFLQIQHTTPTTHHCGPTETTCGNEKSIIHPLKCACSLPWGMQSFHFVLILSFNFISVFTVKRFFYCTFKIVCFMFVAAEATLFLLLLKVLTALSPSAKNKNLKDKVGKARVPWFSAVLD